MILAIESCHKLGFIHRDIKPDVGILRSYFHFSLIYHALIFLTLTIRTFCLLPKDISDSATSALRAYRLRLTFYGCPESHQCISIRTARIYIGHTILPVRISAHRMPTLKVFLMFTAQITNSNVSTCYTSMALTWNPETHHPMARGLNAWIARTSNGSWAAVMVREGSSHGEKRIVGRCAPTAPTSILMTVRLICHSFDSLTVGILGVSARMITHEDDHD